MYEIFFIRFDSHLNRYTHINCAKRKNANVITSIPSEFSDSNVSVCSLSLCFFLSQVFNFRCLLFSHSFSLPFAPLYCGLVYHSSFSPFSMCWHIFYLIEYLILFKWNSIHLYYFYANISIECCWRKKFFSKVLCIVLNSTNTCTKWGKKYIAESQMNEIRRKKILRNYFLQSLSSSFEWSQSQLFVFGFPDQFIWLFPKKQNVLSNINDFKGDL